MSTHKSQIETSISRLNQTAYGTARPNSADFRRILSSDQNVIDLDTQFEDDAAYDTGSDEAFDMWATMSSSAINIPSDFCFQDVGFFLMDIFGGYSVSGSGPYTHVFTPQNMNTSRQMPSRTILKKLGGLKYVLMRDAVLRQFKLTINKTGRLRLQTNYEGSGYYEEDPSGYTSPALTSDREWAYSGQARIWINDDSSGTKQVETATAAGTVSGSGNATVVVTSALFTAQTISVPVTALDAPATWAAKVRTALKANKKVNENYEVGGGTTAIILTARVKAANDATLNISLDNGTSTGITTAATSANTTAGVAGNYQNPGCALETAELTMDNPAAGDGHRQCSSYLVDGDPKSGTVKAEDLVGVRNYVFDFTARLAASDKMRGWLKAGTVVQLEIPIFGIDTNDHSLIFTHTRARVASAKEVADAGDGFIGITGQLRLMSNSGTIPLTAVLVNDVPSYAS